MPLPEHEFFVEEFRGITIVVALPLIDDATLGAAGRTVDAFRAGDTRFVFVVPADRVEVAAAAIGGRAVHGASTWNDDFVADLGALLDDVELYPDEMLSEIARRLGFGELFDDAVGLTSA